MGLVIVISAWGHSHGPAVREPNQRSLAKHFTVATGPRFVVYPGSLPIK